MPDQEYLTLMFMFSKSERCGKKQNRKMFCKRGTDKEPAQLGLLTGYDNSPS